MRKSITSFLIFVSILSNARTKLNNFRVETISYFKLGEFEVNFIEEDSIHVYFLDYDSIWRDYYYHIINGVNLSEWSTLNSGLSENEKFDLFKIRQIVNFPSRYFHFIPFTKGMYTGSFADLFPEKDHLVTAQFKNGRLYGKVIIRDSLGKISSDRFYDNGRISCYEYEFNKNSYQLAYSMEYENEKCEGVRLTKRWYPSGQLEELKRKGDNLLERRSWDSSGYISEYYYSDSITKASRKRWVEKTLVYHAYTLKDKYYRKTYWESGKRKTTEELDYFEGNCYKRLTYDSNGNYLRTEYFEQEVEEDEPEEANEVFEFFEVVDQASFPGGVEGLKRFLEEHFSPHGDELYDFGTVRFQMTFSIDRRGKVYDIEGKYNQAPYSMLALKESIKRTSGLWRPYKCRDRPIDCKMRLNFVVEVNGRY